MIIIAIIFGAISYREWKYLKRNKRSVRTHYLVLGIALLLFISSEALFMLRNDWSIGMFLNAVFEPIQRLLMIES